MSEKLKPCPDCGGDKTVLTEKDGLGLRYIIDCPTCEKEVEE